VLHVISKQIYVFIGADDQQNSFQHPDKIKRRENHTSLEGMMEYWVESSSVVNVCIMLQNDVSN
jgi:hypothetical protein